MKPRKSGIIEFSWYCVIFYMLLIFFMDEKMLHLDLFSGIGGFTLAAQAAGFKTIGFSEINPFCQRVLAKNFPHVKNFGDIKKLNYYDHVDLITGGFPCQPFSVAGKRRGTTDERYLWPEFFRIIKQCKPCWVVAENVTGIVAMELDNILDDLEAEGYKTQSFIIPACAANAPHRRDRLWIIANRSSERCNDRSDSRQGRYLQDHVNGNVKALQSQWEKLKPEPWKVMSAKGWFALNANASRNDDGLSDRVDRAKALGNAIVPQVAFPIIALIANIHTPT